MFEYKNDVSRLETILTVLKLPLRKFLYILSKKYLDSNKPQLAVYAFDYIGTTIAIDGFYEIRELELIEKWLKDRHPDVLKGTCLDIGANIGNHSVYFSNFFHKVRSFEPNPQAFKLLKINTEFLDNVKVFNFGLAEKNRAAKFFTSKHNIGGSSLTSGCENSLEIHVDLFSLNKLDFNNENITFIKIDVEGHEMSVLEGGSNIFRDQSPIVAFEQHKHEFINGESAVINKLKDYGYNNFYCIKSTPHYIKPWMPLKNIIRLTHQIILGASKIVVLQENFQPDFYPLILAVK